MSLLLLGRWLVQGKKRIETRQRLGVLLGFSVFLLNGLGGREGQGATKLRSLPLDLAGCNFCLRYTSLHHHHVLVTPELH